MGRGKKRSTLPAEVRASLTQAFAELLARREREANWQAKEAGRPRVLLYSRANRESLVQAVQQSRLGRHCRAQG